MSRAPRALILTAPGINCDRETAAAFEQAGAEPERVHISQLKTRERLLSDYQILALSGGFSYGDHISAGRLLGLELRKWFGDDLNRFVEAGKAVIGICNGFQVLAETGLLPYGRIDDRDERATSLATNESGKFECRWNNLFIGQSACRFISNQRFGKVVRLPSAHGEGRLQHDYAARNLYDLAQVVFRYCDAAGNPTEVYPDNPNGSPGGVTGICDPDGIVLGMMPHPERAVRQEQFPNWRRGEGAFPHGRIIFDGIVEYTKGA